MGFNNPNMPWWELEATLSDRPSDRRHRDAAAMGAPLVRRHGTRVATARRGAANASPTKPQPTSTAPSRCCDRIRRRCRMPSSIATPTSRSSTAPRIPNNWPRKRRVSASRRSRSPITMVSTGWSASPRRRVRWDCRPCSAPRSPWAQLPVMKVLVGRCSARTTPSNRSPPVWSRIITLPIRTATICSSWPMGPPVTHGLPGR